jgi:hypothetical protein
VRQKLEKVSPDWNYIHTHFGVGYRFAAEIADEAAAAALAAPAARPAPAPLPDAPARAYGAEVAPDPMAVSVPPAPRGVSGARSRRAFA